MFNPGSLHECMCSLGIVHERACHESLLTVGALHKSLFSVCIVPGLLFSVGMVVVQWWHFCRRRFAVLCIDGLCISQCLCCSLHEPMSLVRFFISPCPFLAFESIAGSCMPE